MAAQRKRVLDLCPGTYYGRKRRPPSAAPAATRY